MDSSPPEAQPVPSPVQAPGSVRRWALLLESIGVRRLYTALAPPDLTWPSVGQIEAGRRVPQSWWATARREIRYYATANGLRLALAIPLAIGLGHRPQPVLAVLVAILIGFHAACLLVEGYKRCLLRLAAPSPDPEPASTHLREAPFLPTGWQAPQTWESERVYEALGFRWYRDWTNRFVAWAGGELPPPVRGQRGRNEFIRQTMASESIHWAGAAINAPYLVHFALAGLPGVATYAGSLVVLDGGLALLQRYHRLRAVRSRKKPRS